MPKVKRGESKDAYLKRCIPIVMGEPGTKSQAHAVAKCVGMYDHRLVHNAVNPLKLDPSRTTMLRQKWMADFTRRYNALVIAIKELVLIDDSFGLTANMSACGAGAPGSPGFQPGNTCGKGGEGFYATGVDKVDSALQDWFDFDSASAMREASRGGSLSKWSGTNGEKLTSEEQNRFTIQAKSLQRAALKGNTGHRQLLRGEVYESVDAIKRKYPLNKSVQLDGLTSVTTDVGITKIYQDSQYMGADKGFPVTLHIENPKGIQGLMRNDVEGILPHGAKYRVSRVWDEYGTVHVTLYSSKKQPTTTNSLTNNARWQFLTSDQQLEAFKAWLAQQIGQKIRGDSDAWLEQYVEAGYKKGLERAFTDVRKRKNHELDKNLAFYNGTKEQFLRDSFSRPVSVDRVKLLASRVYNDLDGVNDQMSATLSRTLVDGMIRGDSPRIVADELTRQIGLTKNKALTIARTETLRAHNEGALDAMEDLGVTDVGVAVEWDTAEDGRVCPLCRPLDGIILTIKEARGMFPRHPNCVTGDMVVSASDPLAITKAHFTGQIIELITRMGRRLTITPNHILFTEYGFLPARCVYKGLNLIGTTTGNDGIKTPNYNGDVSSIADVFAAFAESRYMPTISVPFSTKDFHGDGASINGKIDIVRTYSELGGGFHGKQSAEMSLDGCDASIAISESVLDPDSALAEFFKSIPPIFGSNTGFEREFLAFLLGHVLQAQQQRFTAIAGFDSSFVQSALNQCTINPELFRNRLNAHPTLKRINEIVGININSLTAIAFGDRKTGLDEAIFNSVKLDSIMSRDLVAAHSGLVEFDQVVSVNVQHVNNLPVYDVQTESTLYHANGIVASNCRCVPIPANVGESTRGQKRTKERITAAIKQSLSIERGKPSKEKKVLWGGVYKTIGGKRPKSIVGVVNVENMSECGAGAMGDPGFQEGNTCGKGGMGAARMKQREAIKKYKKNLAANRKKMRDSDRETVKKYTQQGITKNHKLSDLRNLNLSRPAVYNWLKDNEQSTSTMVHGMANPELMSIIKLDGVFITYSKGVWDEGKEDFDRTKADTVRDNVAGFLHDIMSSNVPASVWQSNNEIVFTQQRNKADAHWEKTYNMSGFESAATGGDGKICVYKQQFLRIETETFFHETGHNIARRRWGTTDPPDTSFFVRAAKQEKPTTEYAAQALKATGKYSEDFAESVAYYYTSPMFKWDFPKKHAALEKVL